MASLAEQWRHCLEVHGTYLDYPEILEIIRNYPEFTRISRNYQEQSGIHANITDWVENRHTNSKSWTANPKIAGSPEPWKWTPSRPRPCSTPRIRSKSLGQKQTYINDVTHPWTAGEGLEHNPPHPDPGKNQTFFVRAENWYQDVKMD